MGERRVCDTSRSKTKENEEGLLINDNVGRSHIYGLVFDEPL